MVSTETLAIIAIIIASLFWGTAGVAAKILLRSFDPFTLAFMRYVVASLCILPLLWRQKFPPLKKIIFDIVPVALLGAGNIAFFYLGIAKTTVNTGAIIYAATPLLVTALARLTIGERITSMKFLGIMVGFFGVATFFILPALGRKEAVFGTTEGNALILVAVLSWALYTVASKSLTTTKGYSPILVTAVYMFISIPVFFLLMLPTFSPHILEPLEQTKTVLLLLYTGFFVTTVTYVLFQWAIKHSSTTMASLTNYLQPVFAFYFANLFLGEKITKNFLLGSLLVLVGVFLVTGTRIVKEARKILLKRP